MRTLIIGLVCIAQLGAADLAGTWLGEIAYPLNAQHLHLSQQVAMQFVQNGTTLTGKLYGDYGSFPIIEGKIDGDSVDFFVMAQEQQGNQINQTRLHFTGTVQKTGDIELTRVRESSNNSGNKGSYKPSKEGGSKNTFTIHRLP